MNKSLFLKSGQSFIQHDVENKQLKEENGKLRKENENEKLETRNEKVEMTNENKQFKKNNIIKEKLKRRKVLIGVIKISLKKS